ncbi:MAG: hypothetical protein IT385_23585 [Deltaproteobacteria bacterium]|nr:hypothetical protein [Deltaproteobacteria bacterium]
MIVVDILVVILWIVGALIGLVLLVPISYRAEGVATDDALRGSAKVAWGFGVLALHASADGLALRLVGITLWRRRFGRPRRDEPRKDEPKKRKAVEPKGRRGLRWLVARRRLLGAIAGRYVRALHLRMRLDGVVGLAGPDDTARLHQVLAVLDAVLPEGAIDVELDWVEEVVDLEAEIRGWVWPLQIVGITLWLRLDGKTWRALRAAKA